MGSWVKIGFSLLFFLCLDQASAQTIRGGDPECFGEAPPPCNCDVHKDSTAEAQASSQDILQNLKGNPQAQAELEGHFFWDFLKDQRDQTDCNVKMLESLDILPTQIGCSNGSDPSPVYTVADQSKMFASQKALVGQAAILQQVWDAFQDKKDSPGLATADLGCKAQMKELNRLKFISSSTSVYHGEKMVNGENEVQLSAQEAKVMDPKGFCIARETIVKGLWSSQDPQMRAFIERWVGEYEKNPNISNDPSGLNFFRQASGVQSNGQMLKGGNLTAKEWSKTLEGVLKSMSCKAHARQNDLNKYPESEGPIRDDPEYNRELKETLMKDEGVAAFAYIDRTPKYKAVRDPLQCHIEKEYVKIPSSRTMARTGLATGAVAVATLGASLGWEGFGLLGVLVDTGFAADAARDVYNSCGPNSLIPGSLQVTPICEGFNRGKIPSNFASELENQSCTFAVVQGVLAGAGAAFSAGVLAKEIKAASQEAKIIEAAQQVNEERDVILGVETTAESEKPLANTASQEGPGIKLGKPAKPPISQLELDRIATDYADVFTAAPPDKETYVLISKLEKLGSPKEKIKEIIREAEIQCTQEIH